MVTPEEARALRKIGRLQRAGRWLMLIEALAFLTTVLPWAPSLSSAIYSLEWIALSLIVMGGAMAAGTAIYLSLKGLHCPRCHKTFFVEVKPNPRRIRSNRTFFMRREMINQVCMNCGLSIAEADPAFQLNLR